MTKKTCLFAYPAEPTVIGSTVEQCISELNRLSIDREIISWKALDIPGHFIATEILETIDKSDLLIADITRLNFNVTYEIGYAIGKYKRVYLVINKTIKQTKPYITDVGIYDTIGYQFYENSKELGEILKVVKADNPLEITYETNRKQPVFLNEAKYKYDWITLLISRIKKARLFYRSFDPNEQPRLAAHEAIKQVAQSYGVLVHLLGNIQDDYEKHNLCAAFIAGLATGMGKELVIIQNGFDPVPMDYRDLVKSLFHPNDVSGIINDFGAAVTEALQSSYTTTIKKDSTFLQRLDLGASSAENELKALGGYYLETDEFARTGRGEIRIVVGRKGSGKTAIFFQVRDKERASKNNVVLDLKPDGYKFLKFKELVLKLLSDGSYEHTIMIFWEYVLLLELCRKILIDDSKLHLHDHNLAEPYRKLQQLYENDSYFSEGDFSERINSLINKISQDYFLKYKDNESVTLSDPQITELVYSHDIVNLRDALISYMTNKESIWVLVDNIDKGWPTHGIEPRDIIIIRTLLEATRKVERLFRKKGLDVFTVIFLRNDVYELLVEETSDRGKETKVVIDWTDPDMLRELLRRRLVYNGIDQKTKFDEIWPMICVSHVDGEESSQYLIDRTLMRPRFLINLINQCKSFAVNLQHEKIQPDDISKGLFAYSNDIISEISLEIRDVYPEAEDIIYEFIEASKIISEDDIINIINKTTNDNQKSTQLLNALIWYGFLGLYNNDGEPTFIYEVNYNIKTMNALLNKNRKTGVLYYCINQLFWPGLYIQ